MFNFVLACHMFWSDIIFMFIRSNKLAQHIKVQLICVLLSRFTINLDLNVTKKSRSMPIKSVNNSKNSL